MGRRSVKENKNIYQLTREEKGLTREQAADLIDGLSAERIEKIENERVNIYPEDVLLMSKGYKAPELCAYYCSNECPIGTGKIPMPQLKDIAHSSLEILNNINRLSASRERLLEIIEDGDITEDELEDFSVIRQTLERISVSIADLKLWLDKAEAEGRLSM